MNPAPPPSFAGVRRFAGPSGPRSQKETHPDPTDATFLPVALALRPAPGAAALANTGSMTGETTGETFLPRAQAGLVRRPAARGSTPARRRHRGREVPSRDCRRLIDPKLPADLRVTRAGQPVIVVIATSDHVIIVEILHSRSDQAPRRAGHGDGTLWGAAAATAALFLHPAGKGSDPHPIDPRSPVSGVTWGIRVRIPSGGDLRPPPDATGLRSRLQAGGAAAPARADPVRCHVSGQRQPDPTAARGGLPVTVLSSQKY